MSREKYNREQEKMKLAQLKVNLPGYKVSKDGIEVDPDKSKYWQSYLYPNGIAIYVWKYGSIAN